MQGMSGNDTASPRKRSGNSRRPVSTSFRPERAKDDTAEAAQLTYSCRRARLCALPARCNISAVSELIFVAHLFRGRFVLSFLTPAVEFLSAWRIRFRSRYVFRFVKPPARWSGKRPRERRRQSLLLPVLVVSLSTTEKMPPVEHPANPATVSDSLR